MWGGSQPPGIARRELSQPKSTLKYLIPIYLKFHQSVYTIYIKNTGNGLLAKIYISILETVQTLRGAVFSALELGGDGEGGSERRAGTVSPAQCWPRGSGRPKPWAGGCGIGGKKPAGSDLRAWKAARPAGADTGLVLSPGHFLPGLQSDRPLSKAKRQDPGGGVVTPGSQRPQPALTAPASFLPGTAAVGSTPPARTAPPCPAQSAPVGGGGEEGPG